MDVWGQWLPTGANCKCIQKHPKARIYPTHDSRACVCRYLTELPNSPTINIIKYLLDSIPFLFAYRTSWNSFRGFLQLQEPSYARLPSERGANLNTLRKEEGASASATACMQIQYITYWFLYIVIVYVYNTIYYNIYCNVYLHNILYKCINTHTQCTLNNSPRNKIFRVFNVSHLAVPKRRDFWSQKASWNQRCQLHSSQSGIASHNLTYLHSIDTSTHIHIQSHHDVSWWNILWKCKEGNSSATSQPNWSHWNGAQQFLRAK